MVSILLAAAKMAIFGGFPASSRRPRFAFRFGPCRASTNVARKMARLASSRPSQINRRRRIRCQEGQRAGLVEHRGGTDSPGEHRRHRRGALRSCQPDGYPAGRPLDAVRRDGDIPAVQRGLHWRHRAGRQRDVTSLNSRRLPFREPARHFPDIACRVVGKHLIQCLQPSDA